MFKTVPWLLLALFLPIALAGIGGNLQAQDDFLPDGDEWTVFPDLAADSGRFLAVSGRLNAGLPDVDPGPGEPRTDPEQMILQLFFLEEQEVATPNPSLVRVGVFDGEAKSLWDQRDDLPPVAIDVGSQFARPYNTRYRFYADPDGDVAKALAIGGVDALDPVTPTVNVVSDGLDLVLPGGAREPANTKWVEIVNRAGDAAAQGEIAIDGKVFDYYAYTLRVNLEPLVDRELTGFELNGFKLAYTGLARLPKDTIFGLIGGAVDIRTINGIARTEDPLPGEDIPASDLTNQFDGSFDIPFAPLYACDDLVLEEADADWNKLIPPLGDNEPTGIPPDDGGMYWAFDFFSGEFRWVTNIDFKIELPASQQALGRHGVSWELFDPDGLLRLNSQDGTDAGHPSVTAIQQTGAAAPFQASDPISEAVINSFPPTVDDTTGALNIPRWNWKWYGVDARNLVWLKGGLGPDLEPETEIFIACLPETGIAANFKIEYVGPTTSSQKLQALTTNAIEGTTDAQGLWTSTDLAPGLWRIVSAVPVDTSFNWTPTPALPIEFEIDLCDGGGVDVFGTCVEDGSISGMVYCDDDQSGDYVSPPDSPIENVEVELYKSGDIDPTATATTNAAGLYTFPTVAAGTWIVSVDPTQPALSDKKLLGSNQDTVVLAAGDSIEDVDFRFLCTADLGGRVYCDDDQSSSYGAPPDSPLAGVDVTLTKSGAGAPMATATTSALGLYSFGTVEPGTYIVAVDTTQDELEFKKPLSTMQVTVPVTGGDEIDDVDFRFLCIGDLSGRVYCDNNQDGNFIVPPDKPLGGVTVEIRKKGDTALAASATTKAGPDADPTTGTYKFEDLPGGEYVVSVDPDQPALAGTTPLSPMTREETILSGEETKDVDFRLLCPARISGHVWLDLRPCDPDLNGDELPIDGVKVQLIRQDVVAPVVEVMTDALGFFEFKPVDPGEYVIRVPWVGFDPAVNAAVAYYKPFAPPSAELGPLFVEPFDNKTDNDFIFCPSELLVKVVKRPKGDEDCLNEWETGDVNLEGIEVLVTPLVPAGTPVTLTTNVLGEVLLENIPAGTYEISVNPNQAQLLGLKPGVSASGDPIAILQEVAVPLGDAAEAVSVWCEQIEFCTITGEVLRRGEDCISWWPGGGIGDVTVELRDKDGMLEATTTLANGTFRFEDLDKDLAPFTVSIPDGQSVLADLTFLGVKPEEVVTECPAQVTFEYGSAGLEVQIWLDLSCAGIVSGYKPLESNVKIEELFGALRTWDLTTTDGKVRLPSGAVRDLLPGMYRVTVTPINTTGLEGPFTRTDTIDLVVCQAGELEFVYCGVGSIKGRVIKQLIDCDGVIQDGEPGIPEIDITLVPRDVTQDPRTTRTDGDGFYQFLNLPRGEYDVMVADTANNTLRLANLKADGSTNVFVGLVPPAEEVVDFLYCPVSTVKGYVFVEPVGTCGHELIQPGDEPVEGVTVRLLLDGVEIATTETDAAGFYEFKELEWWQGEFTVEVDRDQVSLPFYLWPGDDREVGPFELEPEETKRIDLGYCKQQLSGTVFLEPYGDCDGVYDPPKDTGIDGVTVRLVQTAGDYVGMEWDTTTNGNGDYLFEDLPIGEYEVWVPDTAGDNLLLLEDTTKSSPQPLDPILDPGEWVEDQDFGYCPDPDPARIFGQVFCNPKDRTCDLTYEAGDEPILGATVELYDGAGLFVSDTTTDVNGDYSFEDLLPGDYTVKLPFPQTVFGDCKPNSPFEVTVTLVAGDEKQVDFVLCEPPCEKDCCIGDLHEVVVETKFWVGKIDDDDERWFDVYSFFFDGCDCRAKEIDYAGVYYTGDFPGAEHGYNDVLTLESVYVEDGWAVVRLRLTAQGCLFPRGFFGKKCRTVAVWFNGKWKFGHASFRCECVRPGSWFTWSEECDFPECDEEFSQDVLSSMILEGRPDGCEAEFLTVDTLSYETWVNCEFERPECKDQSESCECGYNVIEFELDYWVNHKKWVERGERNTYKLDLAKWGTKVIDELEFTFQGEEWYGEKVSDRNMAVVTKIRQIDPKANGYEPNSRYDLWRATVLIRACERADGHPGVLPEQLEARTKLAEFPYKYWLDLSPWNKSCLELGVRYWEDEPVGVNILWWRNVLDAAWCEPHPCVRDGDCCSGYCSFCPEPEGDCDDKDCTDCGDTVPQDCGCGK